MQVFGAVMVVSVVRFEPFRELLRRQDPDVRAVRAALARALVRRAMDREITGEPPCSSFGWVRLTKPTGYSSVKMAEAFVLAVKAWVIPPEPVSFFILFSWVRSAQIY